MRGLAWVVTLLLFAGGPLAGCLGGGDDGGEGLTDTSTNESDPNYVAPTGRGPVVAFEETNQTEEGAGGIDHHHDNWNGASRMLIFEQRAKMHPMKTVHAVEYEAEATFRPAPPALIHEGTAKVEFTITSPERHVCEGEDTINGDYACTDNFFGLPNAPDPAPPTGLTLRYKHASTSDWIDVGEIAWDAPLSIDVTRATHTDMPHATASLWEFQVLSPNKADQTLTFIAKAEIIRGVGDIPLWPGHPDFYPNNQTSRVVLDATGVVSGDPGAYGHGAAIVPADAGPVTPDRLISYGTRTLYVWINITDVQAPNPVTAPKSWFLWHTNASGNHNITDSTDVQNHGVEVREHHWVLPVDDQGMDSPYSDGSRWWFMLGGNFDFVVLSGYGDYANWAATYDIKVIASRIPLAEADYDWNCLRPETHCPDPAA